MTVYRDNYPNNIEAPQKLNIEYSHDISFDYSTGEYPDGTESEWHWESNYIPIEHKINGLDVSKHEWMRIKIGEPSFWTYPIRMSANITNIQTVESEIDEETGEFSFTINLTFEDGSIKESNPITIKNGVDGIEITSSQINEDGYLIITYSDGTVENAGRARGEDSSGIPLTGPDDYILSISGNVPVWIMPLQILNAALIANEPLTYDINTGNLEINQADTDTDGYLSSTDWDTFNNKEDAGVAQDIMDTHENNYDHTLIATALQSETDPIFQEWLDTDPLSGFITEETDPIFNEWLSTTPPLYSETDPIFSQWLIDTPPAYPGDIITDHAELISNLGWTSSGHTGTANKLIGFGSSGEAVELTFEKELLFAASDETTVLTAGTTKISGHWPWTCTVISCFVGIKTVSSSGNLTVDFNDNAGNTIFSTRPTILQGERTSLTNPSQPVFSTTSFTKGDAWSLDIDLAGTGAVAIKFYMFGNKN
jgi:hypothetical protein